MRNMLKAILGTVCAALGTLAAAAQDNLVIQYDCIPNYKMKYGDNGPIEVVIPAEGSFSMPLVMGMVKGAPRPEPTKRYLDWLLTEPAQAEFSRGFFRPILASSTPKDIEPKFLPAADYARVKNLDLARMAAASDALKQTWLEQVQRK